MHGTRRMGARLAAVLVSAVLAAAPGVCGAQSSGGSDRPSTEAKPASPGPAETPKPPAKSAAEVGDRLQDSAKGFGEALLDGLKYAGSKVIGFFTDDPAVFATGAVLLAVAAAFQLFDGFQVVATGALRGAGDTRTPMLANLFGHWFIGLPVGYFLGLHLGWGASGVWIGLCIGLILVGAFLAWVWSVRVHELPAI